MRGGRREGQRSEEQGAMEGTGGTLKGEEGTGAHRLDRSGRKRDRRGDEGDQGYHGDRGWERDGGEQGESRVKSGTQLQKQSKDNVIKTLYY